MNSEDVPSPIDFHDERDAGEWERNAMARPHRLDMFEALATLLGRHHARRIIDLGAGPGFLADYLLQLLPDLELTLLDFSVPMLRRARARLGQRAKSVRFIRRNFRESAWNEGLEEFDAAISCQAVHELRHVSHAQQFHTAVRSILSPGGIYLVCDHFLGEGGMQHEALFMTVAGQAEALQSAGFTVVRVLQKGSLVLHAAYPAPDTNPTHQLN